MNSLEDVTLRRFTVSSRLIEVRNEESKSILCSKRQVSRFGCRCYSMPSESCPPLRTFLLR